MSALPQISIPPLQVRGALSGGWDAYSLPDSVKQMGETEYMWGREMTGEEKSEKE